MNKKIRFALFLVFVISAFACAGVTAYASTSSSINYNTYYQLYGKYYAGGLNSPYEPQKTSGDVQVSSASAAVNAEDYVIKGKNGFDFPFVRSFDSAASIDYDIYEHEYNDRHANPVGYVKYYTASTDNSVHAVYFRNEKELMDAGSSFMGKAYSEKDCYYTSLAWKNNPDMSVRYTERDDKFEFRYVDSYYVLKKNSLEYTKNYIMMGQGWKISKPSMGIIDIDRDKSYAEYYVIFQDKDAKAYYLRMNYRRIDGHMTFTDVTDMDGSDIGFKVKFVDPADHTTTAQHSLGFDYSFILENVNGDKYYFTGGLNSSCTIQAVSDRYDNTYVITFDERGMNVADAEGNVYSCSSRGITKTTGDVVTELVKYDKQIINNDVRDPRGQYEVDNEIEFTVYKNSGNDTTIAADEPCKTVYYLKQDYALDELLQVGVFIYSRLPYKIVEPNGLVKNFEYTVNTSWKMGQLPYLYYANYYTVTKYTEQDGADEISRVDYVPTMWVAGRNQKKYSYINGNCVKPYDGDTVKKIMNSTYNVKGLLTSDENTLSGHTYQKNSYSYSSKNRVTRVDAELNINGVTGKTYEGYSYINSLPVVSSKSDNGLTYTYTHHADNYYLPNTTTYKKDDATTIKIESLLTDDGKSVGTENTYENDVLKSTVNYTYDSHGNVASVTKTVDGKTSTATFNYGYAADGGHTVTETIGGITDADGNPCADITTSKTYDYRGNLVSATDANGGTTTMTYDMLNRLLSTHYPDGTSETYTYDTVNNITTMTARNGTVYKNFYDAAGRLKSTCYVDETGNDAITSSYEYDGLGRISMFRRYRFDTNYTTARYEYNCLDQITSEKIYDKSDELVKTTAYAYSNTSDSNSRPIVRVEQSTTGDGGTYAKNIRTYDYRNNLLTDTNKSGSDERTYTYTYDFLSNRLTATNPLGKTEITAYDYASRPISVTNAVGDSKTYEYDESGNLISETDFKGNATTYAYDTAARKISVTSPLDDEQNGLTKTYYDANGNVTKTAVQSNKKGTDVTFDITDYAYDCMNRVTNSAVHPTGDSTIYTQYEYDSLGNVTKQITGLTELLTDTSVIPDGASCITNSYDIRGYLHRKSDEATATNFNSNLYMRNRMGNVEIERMPNEEWLFYDYDALDNVTGVSDYDDNIYFANTYDIMGRRKSMTDETGTTNYEYNAFGELTNEAKNGTIKSYTYDSAGRRTGFTLTDGGQVLKNLTYTYDDLGRMASVSDGTDTTSYSYDANSNLVARSLNGTVYQTNEYNDANLPEKMIFNNADGTEELHRYVYSANGNVGAYHSSAVGTHIYRYNLCGQLTLDTFMDPGEHRYTDYYTYDNRGNIATYRHKYYVGSTSPIDEMTYTYDISNRIVSSTDGTNNFTYEYDDNGNMLSVSKNGEKTREYVYNKINNLMSSTVDGMTTTYAYNGDRLRESKTTNGVTTRHIYDGTDVVADVTGDTTTNFVRGIGLIYSENMNTGDKRKYALNAHGDVAKRINADGTAEKFNYRAYGIGIVGTPDPFGYCGEYTDSETGLIYLRNRYYDPELGRFINVDPIFSGANWYAYCSGNPIRYSDPFGTEQIVVSGGEYRKNGKYKYNFIEPAIKKLKELKANSNGELVTWLIANAGWSKKDLKNFGKVANDIDVRLAYFSKSDNLINYINNKYDGEDRNADKITKFVVFSHGFANGTLSLGYNYDSDYNKNLNFSIDQLGSISENAFNSPNSMFYSCNTGTNTNGEWGNNFAQKWVNKTSGQTWAWNTTTFYDIYKDGSFWQKRYVDMNLFIREGATNYPVGSNGVEAIRFTR